MNSQRCDDLLDNNKIDEEDHKDDEEGDVEKSVLNQSSQHFLPNAEVACQHIRLGQRENYPACMKDGALLCKTQSSGCS